MEWKIYFCYDKNPDLVFIKNLLEYLVSRGVKYNKKDRGEYLISLKTGYISYTEREVGGSTEKLFGIADTYAKYDLNTTSLSILLSYFGEAYFKFFLCIVPDSHGKCGISLETNNGIISNEKQFFAWVNLCKDIFVRFNFAYGSLRNDFEEPISLDVNEFLKELPNYVNFYSRPLVDRIGREKLLSAPAEKVEELENGGVMIVVCALYAWGIGYPDKLEKLWSHLGYK